MDDDELKKILDAHAIWAETGAGEPADLSGADLRGAKLQMANLSGANLQGANLGGAKLQMADLSNADLQGADLTKAIFSGANLTGAKLQGANLTNATFERPLVLKDGVPKKVGEAANLTDADLSDADLSDARLADVTGLLADRLAGANLSNAKLPADIAAFEGLARVEEVSRIARPIFIGILAGCLYTWLTIATTTDARLLTNSATSPLPIIGTEVPVAGFYWAAPIILLGLYLYLQLYLQRLWAGLADLPAVFPDGTPLDKKVYPWLLSGLARAHFKLLWGERSLLSRLENWATIFLAWWIVPLTVLVIWVRYLPRHGWGGTGLHIALLVIAFGGAVLSQGHAAATLRRDVVPFRWRNSWRDGRTCRAAAALGFGLLFSLVSLGAIEGEARRADDGSIVVLPQLATWVPYAFDRLGYRTYANLRAADISTKPATWTGLAERPLERLDSTQVGTARAELALVKGASLAGADLRHAAARFAFLAKSNLAGARLRGADLSEAILLGADLSGADLQGAGLQGTNLRDAVLQGAVLSGANASGADLDRADLRGAVLEAADLRGALLSDADLQGADLSGANLRKANLSRADLQGADLSGTDLEDAELRGANLRGADLSGASLQRARLKAAKLQGVVLSDTNFSGANLQGADLSGTNLQETDFSGVRLQSAVLFDTDLQGADFSNAELQRAVLFLARLQGADLSGANLQGADFADADLRGADLRDAKGLSGERLDEACGDDKTRLPDDLGDYEMKPCPGPEPAPSN